MNILAVNTWFVTLIKQFFFSLDQVVFNFISEIYDLLIAIARTSILTQADIAEIAEKIYALLTVFMVFKVTLSLITYVVNPDDFSDKSKGLSKLGTNIIISLSLLVLTPYIFSYAFELQTIILEDNSLAKLIFETDSSDNSSSSIINTAGDEIAYTAMSAFFTPNVSITEFANCIDLTNTNGEVNVDCSGVKKEGSNYTLDKTHNSGNTMAALTGNGKFEDGDLINYVAGVENKNLGLMFRQDLAVATVKDNQEYVMEYKFVFSTVVGVVIILLLLTYCMDVALRSIKLSFLQLIAPIPILSYVDPKSGKDGLFKKWYDMCFKTYLSLFLRLLALYFAIYIISKVDSMVDIVDGSDVTSTYVKIFVIIGALMFAKQLPKMLEGLGIKLDGDGKFTLNPLKKFEDQALGGKNITGMARGALVGTAGMLTGAGVGAGLSGAWRGLTSGKGWKETGKATAEMNRKMRQAKLDGSTFGGRLGSRFASSLGLETAAGRDKNTIAEYDAEIAKIEQRVEPLKRKQSVLKEIGDTKGAALKRATQKIVTENAKPMFSDLQSQIKQKQARVDYLKNNGGTESEIFAAQDELDKITFKNQKAYVDRNIQAAEARRKGQEYFEYTDVYGNKHKLKVDGTDGQGFEVDSAITDIQENIKHLIGQQEIQEINSERINDGYTEAGETFAEVASFSDISRLSDMATDESRLLDVGEDHIDNVKESKKGTKRTAPKDNVRSLNAAKEGYQQRKRDLQTSDAYKQHKADDEAIK